MIDIQAGKWSCLLSPTLDDLMQWFLNWFNRTPTVWWSRFRRFDEGYLISV